MSILAKSRARGRAGYATTFVTQMEQVLGRCHERGVKVVSNAGGIDPHGCADRVREIADQLGFGVTVAVVDGDDLTGRLDELLSAGELFRHLDTGASLERERPATWWPRMSTSVVTASPPRLRAGADVVITGRVADAAVVSGAAAWWHDWSADDLDALAGATVAGHAIECGTQVTGGNFAFFDRDRRPHRARVSRSPRSPATVAASSPNAPGPAARSPSTRSPPSCSTRSPVPATPSPTSSHASTPYGSASWHPTASKSRRPPANRRRRTPRRC